MNREYFYEHDSTCQELLLDSHEDIESDVLVFLLNLQLCGYRNAEGGTHDSPELKEKDSANLEQSVKICIQGQFFVPNKIRRGARLIFECTPSKNPFLSKKNTSKLR